MSKYYELSEETVAAFKSIQQRTPFPIEIPMKFIGKEQKQLIEIKKVPEQYEFAYGDKLLVMINDEMFSLMDDISIEILLTQELNKIEVNTEKGTIKVNKFGFATFPEIINKYGAEKVMQAQSVMMLYDQQKKDGHETSFNGIQQPPKSSMKSESVNMDEDFLN